MLKKRRRMCEWGCVIVYSASPTSTFIKKMQEKPIRKPQMRLASAQLTKQNTSYE